jgi:hypothetical protein
VPNSRIETCISYMRIMSEASLCFNAMFFLFEVKPEVKSKLLILAKVKFVLFVTFCCLYYYLKILNLCLALLCIIKLCFLIGLFVSMYLYISLLYLSWPRHQFSESNPIVTSFSG